MHDFFLILTGKKNHMHAKRICKDMLEYGLYVIISDNKSIQYFKQVNIKGTYRLQIHIGGRPITSEKWLFTVCTQNNNQEGF